PSAAAAEFDQDSAPPECPARHNPDLETAEFWLPGQPNIRRRQRPRFAKPVHSQKKVPECALQPTRPSLCPAMFQIDQRCPISCRLSHVVDTQAQPQPQSVIGEY